MRHVQADDSSAFEELYDRHSVRAYSLARFVCRDPQRAEEALQDGFLAIWRARASYDPARGSTQAWMLTLIRRRSFDVMRRSGPTELRRATDACLEALQAAEPAAEDVKGQADADRLRALLFDLPTLQRDVVTLAYFGELTHTEIAERLHLPLGTVKGRMRLALHQLRREIDPLRSPASHGINSAALALDTDRGPA